MSSFRSHPALAVTLVAAFLGVLSSSSARAADNSLALNRLIFVSAAGTPTQNGQGLLDTLDRITDATEDKRYTLRLEPGIYDTDETVLAMKSFVDIEGSGRETTLIIGNPNGAMAFGAANSEVRHVTLEHRGGVTTPVVMINADSVRVSHVTLRASGAIESILGCFNNNGSNPVFTDVLIELDGTGASGSAFGMANLTAAPFFDGVRIRVVGGSNVDSYGISSSANDITAPISPLVIRDVDIEVSTVSASAFGLDFSAFSDPPAEVLDSRVVVRASGTADGISNSESNLLIRNSTIDVGFASASAPSDPAGTPSGSSFHGISNTAFAGTFEVQVDNSQITSADNTIVNDAEFTTRIGGSLLAGGNVNDSSGTVICAGVWDEATVFFASSCPGQP